MKILLVASYEDNPRSFIKPQLGLVSIRKYLELHRDDIDIEIADPQVLGADYVKGMFKKGWDIIGFYFTYPTLFNSADLVVSAYLERLKGPTQPWLIGGGPGALYDRILDITSLDIAVRGEGEKFLLKFVQLIERLDLKPPLPTEYLPLFNGIPGDFYIRHVPFQFRATCNQGLFIQTEHFAQDIRDSLMSLDDLNQVTAYSPSWEQKMHTIYADWTLANLARPYDFPVYVTRGCPAPGCLFCCSHRNYMIKHGGIRAAGVEVVVNMIEAVQSSSLDKQAKIMFQDDNFICRHSWVKNLCSLILEKKSSGQIRSDLTFLVKCRVDHLNEELMSIFQKTGIRQLNIGIESGSARVLSEINKSFAPDSYLASVDHLRHWMSKYQIKCHAYLMLFTPKSLPQDLLQTISLAVDFLNQGGEISSYDGILVFPGSPYYELWQQGVVSAYTEIVENPLVRLVGSKAFYQEEKFEDSYLGSVSKQVEIPVALKLQYRETEEIWLKYKERFPVFWEHFQRKFKWLASTSFRAGWVKLYTILEVMDNLYRSVPLINEIRYLKSNLLMLIDSLE